MFETSILSIGTELTTGRIRDSNAAWLACHLEAMGARVSSIVFLPDVTEAIAVEIRRARERGGVLIVTGGLGPTADDVTREAVAEAYDIPLKFHDKIWEALVKRFAPQPLPQANRKQAMIPAGATVLPNETGTAPGFWIGERDSALFVLPGPPLEMEPMFEHGVRPILIEILELRVPDDLRATAYLVPESALEDAIRSCAPPAMRWGTRFEDRGVFFSLSDGTEAERRRVFEKLRLEFGEARIAEGWEPPETRLIEALVASKRKIVFVESCTGGLISRWMTDHAGSSRAFWGAYIVYADEAKLRMLGVDAMALERHGAVSGEIARDLAERAVERSGADIAVAVTGIAGPEGGSEEKPVGTVWIAGAVRGEAGSAVLHRFRGNRVRIRAQSGLAALLEGLRLARR